MSTQTAPTQPLKLRLTSYLKKGWPFLIKVIGPSLTIIALLLSIYQLYQADKTEKEIKGISESISTRYVDTFPRNMPEITNLIGTTKNSLLIVTDVAAYAQYSGPGAFDEYNSVLHRLASPDKKIDIKLLCYDSETESVYREKQFGIKNEEEFKKLQDTEMYKAWIRHRGGKNPPQSVKDFYDLLHERNRTFLNDLSDRNVKIKVTKKELPVFLWIVDGKEAIFSFYNYGKSPREVSFRTIDQNLIKKLQEIADTAFTDTDSREYVSAK